MTETQAWGLTARPTIAETNDTYLDLSTNIKYVWENGGWQQEPYSGASAKTATVTISVADWNSGTTCTKSVTGVTASNVVFCDSSNTDVQCTAQAEGTLTFTATSTPTTATTVKVVILP